MSDQVAAEKQRQKLQQLAEIEGFESVEALLNAFGADSVSPGICFNPAEPDCDFTVEVEPDQDRGWCEVCGTNSMASALVLAGLI